MPGLPRLTALEAEARRPQTQRISPAVPHFGTQRETYRSAQVVYDFTVITCTILSLYDSSARNNLTTRRGQTGLLIAGKRDVLKRQFLSLGACMAHRLPGDTPTETATLADRDFHMLSASADETGQGGCALWTNKQHVYACDGQQGHRLKPEHVVVASFSSRHLQVHNCLTTPDPRRPSPTCPPCGCARGARCAGFLA